jgi:amino-acid N-acetyltransferase
MDLNGILGVTVSGVREEERPAVMDLIGACGLHTEDLTDEMLRDFLVARKGGDLAGVIGLEICGSDALLRSLAVSEKHRGQGVGRKLADSVEKIARSCGVRTLYLLTLTAEDFLTRRGYEKIDRDRAPEKILATAEFSRFCPSSAVCMRKAIGG